MKAPLSLSESQIISYIEQSFDLKISSLEFLPYGESSWLYIATQVNSGDKMVIKIQKEVNELATFVLKYLGEHTFKWIPRMVFDKKNQPWSLIEGLCFSIHQYIEPKELATAFDRPNKEYLSQLGVLLKDLHSVPILEEVRMKMPYERFESSFYEYAKESIDLVLGLPNDEEAIDRVQKILRKQEDKINQIFQNSKKLGSDLVKTEHQFHITHGDVHFGNILQPKDDHLYLIDWDCTMVALPEYDLMYFDDEQLKDISVGYGNDLLADKIAIQYYRCHLILRAFWFWINKALRSETEEEALPVWESFIRIIDDSPYFLRALMV